MEVIDNNKSILQLRIQKKIKHLLLDIFSKSEMSINNKKFFITITNVDISPDLKNLKILIDSIVLNEVEKSKVAKALNKDHIFEIKRLLAKKVNLRYVPDVIFVPDNSSKKMQIVEKILKDSI